ncbi:pyridoxamine 5'-phosphate oxidase family protein [Myxosarcina sp. GI1]|uniref:pyridoxamine 5'-phosphate oxidase family protein n=1 Tax=Myxosarcina sp. GI1 TaxID=1541065 RepID=UPI00055AEB40|nr:pyridoxamine 5'-phosphate oxidase family protein [Myxosarcina sp. GI1]
MRRKFTEIAFTPGVKTAQTQYGSREMYENFVKQGITEDILTEKETEFIQSRDSFYLGTVSSNGYPYIQFRGGAPGFLKIIDKKTLGFADFKGNLQYISAGNLIDNDRIFLFLMDYANRRRLKIWGRGKVVDANNASELLGKLAVPDYPAEVERGILIKIEAMSWNCPQHIPRKYSEAEVAAKIAPLQARIKELEELLYG